MLKNIINRFIKTNTTQTTNDNTEYFSPGYNAIMNLKEVDSNATVDIPLAERLRECVLTEYERNNRNTAYYKDGYLYDVSPRNRAISLDEDRGVAYDARFVVIDGEKHDLYNPRDVAFMRLPEFKQQDSAFGYVTRNFAYIMNMRAKRTYLPILAIPIVFQAANLMIRSGYTMKKDYLRLVAQLEGVGLPKYAQYLREELEEIVPSMTDDNYMRKLFLKNRLTLAKELKTDLLMSNTLGVTCGECAKYEGRVYSISGTDKRFPKLPEMVFEYGNFHPGCCHGFLPFNDRIEKTISLYERKEDGSVVEKKVNAIKYSNRPFVDNRTDQEKERYEKLTKEREKKHHWDYDSLVKHLKRASEYDWICRHLPNMAPKSLGGYTRMKHSNSKNYLKIKEAAAKMGRELIE